jgi:SAM-dependent methyltransferase
MGQLSAGSGAAHSGKLTSAQIAAHDRQRELGVDGDRELTRLFASVYPAGGLVADAGGGTGLATPLLVAAGLRVVLLDISASMLASASWPVPRVLADLCRLPLPRCCVDGIYAAYVIQNIPRWPQALAEIARVVKPGGVALVALGNPPADEISSHVSRHYLDALRDAGAHQVGVVAESTGLRSTDDAVAAMRGLGLELAGVHEISGQQTRSIRDLIELRSRNPFLARASDEIVSAARDRTLAWAASRYGDLDNPRTIPVRRSLHEFRHGHTTVAEVR